MAEEKEEKVPVPSPDLDSLIKKLLDVEGYVIFVGSLSNEKDKEGNRMINFDYRRYHFSYEDVKTTIKKFREMFLDDIAKDLGE
mgnify:CR=1 FL=1